MYHMGYRIKVSHESAVEVACSTGWWCDTLIGYINVMTMFHNGILTWDTTIRYPDGIYQWDLTEVLNSVGKSYTIFNWILRVSLWDTLMGYINWIHVTCGHWIPPWDPLGGKMTWHEGHMTAGGGIPSQCLMNFISNWGIQLTYLPSMYPMRYPIAVSNWCFLTVLYPIEVSNDGFFLQLSNGDMYHESPVVGCRDGIPSLDRVSNQGIQWWKKVLPMWCQDIQGKHDNWHVLVR